ncbi:TIGR01244 family phosphatase [Brevundimonas sp. AJA228-03]|uniref:TIGR01244 family sulfur transferase n=1 Tax=Brevundimonas sp. AJA228-03 TaxID=2752515 RepID=UPI001AE0AA0C|nr:TIGR01244 family sulfur transferase [Brevundimonas sp. AJA228-03]QTN18787.1 TIGR01244 family phosphatase [Brevundimonas sp. AJA228-03]
MTAFYQTLDAGTLVAPQIALDSLAAFADAGVVVVISHRPDNEDPGQPSADEMASAVAAAGMRFVHAPVRGLPDEAAVTATATAIAALEPQERVLMFCRSGTRSAMAWALAMRALDRSDAQTLREAAAAAGYDLSRLPL